MPISKVGILAGLSIIGLASWIHSLSVSQLLRDLLPGVFDIFNQLVVVAPFMLFLGFYIFFFSLFRRPFFALIPTIPVAIVLAMLLWT